MGVGEGGCKPVQGLGQASQEASKKKWYLYSVCSMCKALWGRGGAECAVCMLGKEGSCGHLLHPTLSGRSLRSPILWRHWARPLWFLRPNSLTSLRNPEQETLCPAATGKVNIDCFIPLKSLLAIPTTMTLVQATTVSSGVLYQPHNPPPCL